MQSQYIRRRSQAVRQSSAKAPFISSILIGASSYIRRLLPFRALVVSDRLHFRWPLFFFFCLIVSASISPSAFSQKKKTRAIVYKKEHLGYKINSTYNEMLPIISPNGKYLYFTMGRGNPRNIGDIKYQDIYVSTLSNEGIWSFPKNLGTTFNSVYDDAISGVSPDGKMLFIKNTSRNSTNGLCFARHISEDKWQIDSITIENYYRLSPPTSETITINGNYIILSIERSDGYGGLDLYVSKIKDRKKNLYSEPQNLGPVINTAKNEIAPFIASDGQTLYFSSDGLPGEGGGDVFITKRFDDSWVNWGYPVNMGPEINTPGMDAYYSVPASGDKAYFSSSNGNNLLDLFSIPLKDYQRPKPVMFMSGTVKSRSGTPIRATIMCTNLSENSEIATAESLQEDGTFSLIAPVGDHYRIRAEAPGFLSFSDDLDLSKQSGFSEPAFDIVLDSIIVGSKVILGDIFFDFNSSTLQEASFYTLDKQATFLVDAKDISLEIEGHTDSLGGDEYNKELSQRRADAVKMYLVEKGIDRSRLTTRGFGSEQPISDNETEEGRRMNRRVVFRITRIDIPKKK
jgi:OOP family OmpA-OmpF porin